jgi:hypothetical protein
LRGTLLLFSSLCSHLFLTADNLLSSMVTTDRSLYLIDISLEHNFDVATAGVASEVEMSESEKVDFPATTEAVVEHNINKRERDEGVDEEEETQEPPQQKPRVNDDGSPEDTTGEMQQQEQDPASLTQATEDTQNQTNMSEAPAAGAGPAPNNQQPAMHPQMSTPAMYGTAGGYRMPMVPYPGNFNPAMMQQQFQMMAGRGFQGQMPWQPQMGQYPMQMQQQQHPQGQQHPNMGQPGQQQQQQPAQQQPASHPTGQQQPAQAQPTPIDMNAPKPEGITADENAGVSSVSSPDQSQQHTQQAQQQQQQPPPPPPQQQGQQPQQGMYPPQMPHNAMQMQQFYGGPMQQQQQQQHQPGGPGPNRMMYPMGPGGMMPQYAHATGHPHGGARGPPPPFLQPAPVVPTNGISLALSCDDEQLSEYQILVRKQLEIFEALQEDVESNTQGRKRQVALGQVGIRCRHCAGYPLRQRGRGAVYYPAKLQGKSKTNRGFCEGGKIVPLDSLWIWIVVYECRGISSVSEYGKQSFV